MVGGPVVCKILGARSGGLSRSQTVDSPPPHSLLVRPFPFRYIGRLFNGDVSMTLFGAFRKTLWQARVNLPVRSRQIKFSDEEEAAPLLTPKPAIPGKQPFTIYLDFGVENKFPW